MDTNNVAPGGSEIAAVTPASETYSGASAAARELANLRWKRDNPEPAQEAQPNDDTAVTVRDSNESQELAAEANAAPEQEPGEQTQEADPAEELPPIEPPRSWTREEKERFNSLPRETQEYLANREQERERDFRTRQNEAAEQRKAAEAERTKAEQARQQYEAALPALINQLQANLLGEFADIRTPEDQIRVSKEDPFRYGQYLAQKSYIDQRVSEYQQTIGRQQAEYSQKWNDFAREQDKLFADRFSVSDKAKLQQIMDEAAKGIKEVGFSDDDLANLWNGQSSVSLRDARLQHIVAEWAQFRLAKQAAAKPAPKPVPQVQRPGVASNRQSAANANIQALEQS